MQWHIYKYKQNLAREVWLAESERDRDCPRGREGGSTMDWGRPPPKIWFECDIWIFAFQGEVTILWGTTMDWGQPPPEIWFQLEMFYTCSWPRDGLQHFVQISSQDNLKSNPDPIHQSPRSNIFAQWEKGEREYFSLHFGTKSQRHWVKAQRCSTLDFFSQIQILLTLYKCVQLCKIAFRGRNRKVSLCRINKAVLTRFSAKKWEKWRLAPATTVVHNSREPCTVFIRGKPVFGRPWVRTMDYQWSKGCPYQDSPSSAVSS